MVVLMLCSHRSGKVLIVEGRRGGCRSSAYQLNTGTQIVVIVMGISKMVMVVLGGDRNTRFALSCQRLQTVCCILSNVAAILFLFVVHTIAMRQRRWISYCVLNLLLSMMRLLLISLFCPNSSFDGRRRRGHTSTSLSFVSRKP